MSKTLKDRVAFFTHHQKAPSHYYQKEKRVFAFQDIPQDVKDATYLTDSGYLAPIINRNSKKSRSMQARLKVTHRRQQRAKNQEELRELINSY